MSDSEWTTGIREGYRTKIIKTGNAIVTIHRPILSDEERRKVENQIKMAMLNMAAAESGEKRDQQSA